MLLDEGDDSATCLQDVLPILARSLHLGSLTTLMQCSHSLALAGLHLLHDTTLTLRQADVLKAQYARSPGSRGRGYTWLLTRTPMQTLIVDSAWLRLLSASAPLAPPPIPSPIPASASTPADSSALPIPSAIWAPCRLLRCLHLEGLHLDRGAWGQLLDELAVLQSAGQLPRLKEMQLLRCSLAGPPNPSRRTYSWLKLAVKQRLEAEQHAEEEEERSRQAGAGCVVPPPRLTLLILVLTASGGGLLSALLPHLEASNLQELVVGGGPVGEQFHCLASGRLPKLRRLVVATGKAVLVHQFEVLLAHPALREVCLNEITHGGLCRISISSRSVSKVYHGT